MSNFTRLQHDVYIHCSHCGEVMTACGEKTVGIKDNFQHWLIRPCECQTESKIATFISDLQTRLEGLKDGA